MGGSQAGRVVVITGASSGVGRATARALAREGAHLALLARGIEALAATAREVEMLGGTALAIPVDVAMPEEVELAAEHIERQLGPIDAWVNGAMASVFSAAHQMNAGDFRRVTDVTFLGTVHGTLAALRRMRPRDRGVIVQLVPVEGYRGAPLQSAYCAAKHAVVAFSRSVRGELLMDRSHVRLALVRLPALDTPLFDWAKNRMQRRPRPAAPVYAPQVAARAVLWAIHHPRRPRRLVPAALERLLLRRRCAAQQGDEARDPRRASNLWAPVSGDHGATGALTPPAGARRRSLRLWARFHRAGVATTVMALGGAGLLAATYLTRRA